MTDITRSSFGSRFQVAVVGAGPAGATAALCLARAGVRTLLIDGSTTDNAPPGECLAPSATRLLKQLDLFQSFRETQPLPCYGNRSAWGADGRLIDYDFIRDPAGHGWHLDRARFDCMLLETARAAGAVIAEQSRLAAVANECKEWRLSIDSPAGASTVLTDFVVDASGRRAAFARSLSLRRICLDRLLAVVGYLSPGAGMAEDSSTLVEAVRDGWWYSALLPDGRMVATFMTDPDILDRTRAWTRDGWTALLGTAPHTLARLRALQYRLSSPPRVAPAGTSHLSRVSGRRWLAVGDAAVSYDPLSSHGIGTALSSAARASRDVCSYLEGTVETVDGYAAWLQAGFDHFLPTWHACYAQEMRWHDAPFWSRRQAAATVGQDEPWQQSVRE